MRVTDPPWRIMCLSGESVEVVLVHMDPAGRAHTFDVHAINSRWWAVDAWSHGARPIASATAVSLHSSLLSTILNQLEKTSSPFVATYCDFHASDV